MNKITKDMTIGKILALGGENAAKILVSNGMHCVGCPSAAQESIEEACEVHGMNIEKVLDELNANIAG